MSAESLFGALAATVFPGERLGPGTGPGAALIFGAIILVQLPEAFLRCRFAGAVHDLKGGQGWRTLARGRVARMSPAPAVLELSRSIALAKATTTILDDQPASQHLPLPTHPALDAVQAMPGLEIHFAAQAWPPCSKASLTRNRGHEQTHFTRRTAITPRRRMASVA